MYYKCHEIRLTSGRSYVDSPDWIKHKKLTINLKNEDDKCFQYVVTIVLNYREIK